MLTNRKIRRARARGLQLVSHILLAVQALSLGHLLATRHITCPEHGDIMHVEDAVRTPSDRSTEGADLPLRSGLASNETTASAGHHHCLVCAEAGRRCYLATPEHPFATRVFIVGETPPVSPAFLAPIDLILLSPKNSPPSV